MSTPPRSRPNTSIPSQPARDNAPRRLIVTASVVIFAVRDWSLWVLVREGPWGPPMRLVLGNESVTDAVDRTVDALLMWPDQACLLQFKAGWQEQQVHVWGSNEKGAAVTLIHSLLLRANRDELRPNLHLQPVPSLHVHWTPVQDIESGHYTVDTDVLPVLQTALHTMRSQVQRDPEIVLRYLADMGKAPGREDSKRDRRRQDTDAVRSKDTLALSVLKEPAIGDDSLTLAEAALLYRAFFPAEEPIDLSNLRRRFLATNSLAPLEEERPVRGREVDWRRVSRAYRYQGNLPKSPLHLDKIE